MSSWVCLGDEKKSLMAFSPSVVVLYLKVMLLVFFVGSCIFFFFFMNKDLVEPSFIIDGDNPPKIVGQ